MLRKQSCVKVDDNALLSLLGGLPKDFICLRDQILEEDVRMNENHHSLSH